MGEDKSRLVYHGKPQRDYLTELLQPYCETVFWSVNADQAAALARSEQPIVTDALDVPGPLNGILSAFRHDPTAAWFVVACDMPLLTARSFDALVSGRNPAGLARVFYDSDGQFPEPLLGIYEPAFGPIADEALTAGHYSPRRLLQQNDVQLLTAPDVRELLNVNDPTTRTRLGF